MKLYVDSALEALVLTVENKKFTAGTNSSVFEITGNEFMITLLPVCPESGFFLPVTAHIIDGNFIGENDFFRVVKWDAGIIEIIVDFPEQLKPPEPPELLESLVYKLSSGKERRVELYRDNGLQLYIYDMNKDERCFWLSDGSGGSMCLLDIGGEKLLIILSGESSGETLIAVNESCEEVLRINADRCIIDDGYLSAVTALNTVSGHEKRERYEFISGSFKKLPDEIGFFTQSPQMPADECETALAFVQSLKLSCDNEIKMFLSEELYRNFTALQLREFLGEFDECRIAPWQIGEKGSYEKTSDEKTDEKADETEIVLGLIKDGIAVKYIFTVSGGVITDITAE